MPLPGERSIAGETRRPAAPVRPDGRNHEAEYDGLTPRFRLVAFHVTDQLRRSEHMQEAESFRLRPCMAQQFQSLPRPLPQRQRVLQAPISCQQRVPHDAMSGLLQRPDQVSGRWNIRGYRLHEPLEILEGDASFEAPSFVSERLHDLRDYRMVTSGRKAD